MIEKLSDYILSPLGVGTEANYKAVKEGRSALRAYPPTELIPQGWYASLFKEGDLSGIYSSLDLKEDQWTEFEKRCISCAEPAIRDAGIDPKSERVIFIISSTKGNTELLYDNRWGFPPEREYLAEAAQKVVGWFGNPNTPIVVSNACISGLCAQIAAQRALESRRYDTAVVIGADVVGRFIISGFQCLRALSPELCRPFDEKRCGLNLGEAAACIIYGYTPEAVPGKWYALKGSITNDANHISGPSRTGEGGYRALSSVLSSCGEVAGDLSFVNVHGTATVYNDEMESFAVTRAGLENLPVVSLKGYFGHTLGAAGVLETIIAMAAVEDGMVPGTRGFETMGVSNPLKVSSNALPSEKQSFAKLLSGFGGCNASMIFSRNVSGNLLPQMDKTPIKELHHVEITPDKAVLDGEEISSGENILERLYRERIGSYPKFFKMDPLARLGFVASELLLKAEGKEVYDTSSRGSILFNRSASLADDTRFQESIDAPDHMGRPSFFVYTLPNIVTGEIAIRNKYFGESSFYVIPDDDKDLMERIVSDAFSQEETLQALVCGWCECPVEGEFSAKMSIFARI